MHALSNQKYYKGAYLFKLTKIVVFPQCFKVIKSIGVVKAIGMIYFSIFRVGGKLKTIKRGSNMSVLVLLTS